MISRTLEKAWKYENKMEKNIPEEARPVFHLSPRTGWMNDPNGFSCYKGQYHLFYQYHPYNAMWGPMHWGHAVSEDLLHWTYLPAAIAPDMPYDRDGCFSGSAVALPDGQHMLLYTGVCREKQADGSVQDRQRQCVAIGDGIHYTKISANPVLGEKDLPEGACPGDFRDPKIWRDEDGVFRSLIASRDAQDAGQYLMYESRDGITWAYSGKLAVNGNRIGTMWECPDFFSLDGKQILLGSAQDMLPEGLEYDNGNGAFCFIGKYDRSTKTFTKEADQAVDYGIDFYAEQTVLSPDGRRIMIAWMQNWDTSGFHAPDQPWFGQMTLPRELSVRNGRLFQQPVRELELLRREKTEAMALKVSGRRATVPGVSGRYIDMTVAVRPSEDAGMYKRFTVRFAENDRYYSSISYTPGDETLLVSRKYSGSRRAILHERKAKVKLEEGALQLRIILDRYSAEIFAQDGSTVMTFTLDTPEEADGISFEADGDVFADIVKYSLER